MKRLRLAFPTVALIGLLVGAAEVSARAGDPAAAARAYIAALNAGNVEAALGLFADDATYTISPPSVVTGQAVIVGRDGLRPFLTTLVAEHVSIREGGTARVAGERATGVLTVSNDAQRRLGLAALEAEYELVLQGDKIKAFTFTYTPDSVARVHAATAAAPHPPAQVPRALPRTGEPISLVGALVPAGVTALLTGFALRRRSV
jgi:SnoaL-like domain